MDRRTAQLLGALAGGIAVVGFIAARRFGPPPCPGGVFFELSPPLVQPGRYRFELALDGGRSCAFDVPMPAPGAVDTSACGLVLELVTATEGGAVRIVGLNVAASPSRIALRVLHNGAPAFASDTSPKYSEYPVLRADDPVFCGDRARVSPPCVRGSAQCQPFAAKCDGPEDCTRGEVCCASVEWAKERGADAATACLKETKCRDAYAEVVCHSAGDCGARARCDSETLRGEFRPELAVCRGGR